MSSGESRPGHADSPEPGAAEAAPPARASRRVLALINPNAGRFEPHRLMEWITEGAEELDADITFVVIEPGERMRDFTARAALDGYELVLVAGGDGTLAEAAAGLVGSALPMAIIPAGTGNILATNLNVPFGIKEATMAALQGAAAPFDVGRLDDGRIFLLAAGAGYDADLIRDADRELKRWLGPVAYIVSMFRNLRAKHGRFNVELDGWQRIRINARTVLVCNAGRTLGSIPLAPDADLGDGWLDLVIFRFRNPLALFGIFLTAIFRGLKKDPRVQFFRARRIRIQASRPMPVQVDGDFIDRTTPIEMTILPGALQVVRPPHAPPFDLSRLTEDALKALRQVTTPPSH